MIRLMRHVLQHQRRFLIRLVPALALGALSLPSTAVLAPVEAQSEPLTVFAAASLKETLEEAGKVYTAQSGVEVRFSFAGSSALAKQIEAAAPADVFASADLKWMDYLDDKKLIRHDTRINLLGNDLVVIAPNTSTLRTLDFTVDAFVQALGDGRLTTGDVNAVPVGVYAKAALQKLGLWSVVEPKLAQTDNVRAALAFVARQEAALGIVYRTDAQVERAVKIVATFPAESHEPIVYPFAVTATTKHPAAEAFLTFLNSPTARAIFEKAGFPVRVP